VTHVKNMKDYWSTTEQLVSHFYSKIMSQEISSHS
jgi:hypothetical protein